MDSIRTRGLTIAEALNAYDSCLRTSCCTKYVIIQETKASSTFAVVPKISCCCCRFFKRICCGSNYYTKEQANKHMIAAAIKTFIDNNPAAITEQMLEALRCLAYRFGDAATPFKNAIERPLIQASTTFEGNIPWLASDPASTTASSTSSLITAAATPSPASATHSN